MVSAYNAQGGKEGKLMKRHISTVLLLSSVDYSLNSVFMHQGNNIYTFIEMRKQETSLHSL